jgi:glycosyltransferase involved in cell wall biosynthesis
VTPPEAGRPAVYQLLAAAAPHDAVTGQAIALRDELARAGINSAIAAEHIDGALIADVLPLGAVPAGAPALLRYSLWSAAAELALQDTGPLGVIYHNITPAQFLESANPAVAALCAKGRAELPKIATRAMVSIADSAYNARELRDAGAEHVAVVPLLLDLPAPPTIPRAGTDRVLFVGRLAPNKRVEDCIDAVALLRRSRPATELHVVGSGDAFPRYEAALHHHARVNGLANAVQFHGRVDDYARDALYATSGAYISLSEHEGFCVPVLEAMSRGLPVVARDAGAVRETAGGGALLVPERNAALAAAALDAAISDERIRAGLAANARHRLAQLDRSLVAGRLIDAIGDLVR